MRTSTLVSYGRWALVLALVMPACANRGMEAPEPDGTGGAHGTGGSGTGGAPATGGTAGSGRGGTTGTGGTSTGGVPGTGGTSTGGVPGTGGTHTGGVPGTGGTSTGGVPGTGGTSTGGVPGTGGTSTGGVPGTGGQAGSAATGGTAGSAATGGSAGGMGGAAGKGMAGAGGGAAGAPATGGSGGHGGAAGSGANVCAASTTLDCTAAGALTLAPDGVVTDFSAAQWSAGTATWCNADGLSGSIFSYGTMTTATFAAAVDTTAANPNLKLNLTVPTSGYAGGGILFNSCVNASAFTALSFSAVVTAGSLTNCTWFVQLQTQDQRPNTATNPGGGTCNPTTTTCYQSPSSPNLAAPTTTGKTYSQAFTTFTGMTAIPADTQIVGIQWQVNGSTSGGCTVELRTDDIKFTP